jgi:hypothetical protein
LSATTHESHTSAAIEPPGPRGGLILGSMRDFQRDKLGFIQGLMRYGDVARYRTAHLTW